VAKEVNILTFQGMSGLVEVLSIVFQDTVAPVLIPFMCWHGNYISCGLATTWLALPLEDFRFRGKRTCYCKGVAIVGNLRAKLVNSCEKGDQEVVQVRQWACGG
jgi:hypothetical protein